MKRKKIVKSKRAESKFILINTHIYRCHLLVTWEQDINKITKYLTARGIKEQEDFKQVLGGLINSNALGTVVTIGSKQNTDLCAWLRVKPQKMSEFGALYHELHHAVDKFAEDHNLMDETEAKAYLFEHLVNECHKILWK